MFSSCTCLPWPLSSCDSWSLSDIPPERVFEVFDRWLGKAWLHPLRASGIFIFGMTLVFLSALPLSWVSLDLLSCLDCCSTSLLPWDRCGFSFLVLTYYCSFYYCVFLFVILSFGDLLLLEDTLFLELLPWFEALGALLRFGETSIIFDLNTGIGDIDDLLDFDLMSSIIRFSVIGVLVFRVLGSLLSESPDISSWKWTEFLEFLD